MTSPMPLRSPIVLSIAIAISSAVLPPADAVIDRPTSWREHRKVRRCERMGYVVAGDALGCKCS